MKRMTVRVILRGVDLDVTGTYHPRSYGSRIDPPEEAEFDIATVTSVTIPPIDFTALLANRQYGTMPEEFLDSITELAIERAEEIGSE